MPGKEQCITCDKNDGTIIGNECQQRTYDKHSIKHRQQITHQLDHIIREYDLLKQEYEQSLNEHSLLKNINQWGKDSIIKIQIIAETARQDLRQMIEKSKERFSKTYNDISMNLHLSGQTNNYSEKELTHWIEQF